MGNSLSEGEEIEQEIGDKLYEMVRTYYPQNADNITGALLELGYEELNRLLTASDQRELEDRMHCAASSLLPSSVPRAKDKTSESSLAHGTVNQQNGFHWSKKDLCGMENLPHNKHGKDSNGIRKSENAITPNGMAELLRHEDWHENKLALGERLYYQIEKDYPEQADKITGILLEIDSQTLAKLVENPDVLKTRVKEALKVLESASENPKNGLSSPAAEKYSHDKTVLGEQLYGLVSILNPDEAEQITGMLLELDTKELEALLTDQRALNKRVQQAVEALNSTDKRHGVESDSGSLLQADRKASTGEQLYDIISDWYPNQVDKITGMLLELDTKYLEVFLTNEQVLKEKVNVAIEALNSPEQQCDDKPVIMSLQHEDQMVVIGEKLHDIISEWYPNEVDKITGMLLELDREDLEILITDEQALKEKVDLAIEALNSPEQQHDSKSVGTFLPQEDKTTNIGEQLYYIISDWYPNQVDKITGMLLELDLSILNSLLKDSVALRGKADQAAGVLVEFNESKRTPEEDFVSSKFATENEQTDGCTNCDLRNTLGVQLFDVIEQWYPGNADKLTGMLLDLDCESLTVLVQDHYLLREKVDLAFHALDKNSSNK